MMVLTPQLRQSLEMLQMPVLELRTLIREEMEKNPTLEDGPDSDAPESESAAEAAELPEVSETTATLAAESAPSGSGETEPEALDFSKEYDVLARLDDDWRDYLFQDSQNRTFSADDAQRRQHFLDSLPQTESLQEHLLEQMRLTELDPADRQAAELLIGSINDDGYLVGDLAELAASAGQTLEHMEALLALVHDFHPTGVGARDLRECLLLQLDRQGRGAAIETVIVRDHLTLLAGHKYLELARALHESVESVQVAAAAIAQLNPHPGRLYSGGAAEYISAEVVVVKRDGRWVVILRDDDLPRVRISRHYRRLMEDPATPADVKAYVQERIRSGAALIKGIQQRQRTIQTIAEEIVRVQTPFLDEGIAHLRPLTMSQVAERVGFHETTVSRTVSGKYMQTPLGLFEMKYFFTTGIKTEGGQELSNKVVKDMIAELVATEDSERPLSDQDIVALLKERGIPLARRTVSKYRIVLRIPPSHMRRRF